MTAPGSINLKRILWPVAIVTLAALATWRACRPSAKTGTIWSCGETASGCTCGGSLEEVDRPKEKLCKREYECCVVEREASLNTTRLVATAGTRVRQAPVVNHGCPNNRFWGGVAWRGVNDQALPQIDADARHGLRPGWSAGRVEGCSRARVIDSPSCCLMVQQKLPAGVPPNFKGSLRDRDVLEGTSSAPSRIARSRKRTSTTTAGRA
jgi:hypothetical protein